MLEETRFHDSGRRARSPIVSPLDEPGHSRNIHVGPALSSAYQSSYITRIHNTLNRAVSCMLSNTPPSPPPPPPDLSAPLSHLRIPLSRPFHYTPTSTARQGVIFLLLTPFTASDERDCTRLKSLRETWDPAYGRWSPHITLLRPFPIPPTAGDPPFTSLNTYIKHVTRRVDDERTIHPCPSRQRVGTVSRANNPPRQAGNLSSSRVQKRPPPCGG